MDELRIGNQIIRYDREMTIRPYASMERGDADRCGCSYCRNFAAQRLTVYPPSFLTLLDHLGVDPNKEGEVYECGPARERRHYGGWLFLSGELVQAGDRAKASDNPDFEYRFDDAYKPPPEADFGEQFMVVEFYTTVPWILDEEP
jgi:hypothetical protein